MKKTPLFYWCIRRYEGLLRFFIYRYRVIMKYIYRLIDRNDELMVDIGGGNNLRRHWKSLDYPSRHYRFPIGIIDYKLDLMKFKPLPFKDNSVALFYTSHTLSHFYRICSNHVIKEAYRCLKPGGLFRIATPNFNYPEIFGHIDSVQIDNKKHVNKLTHSDLVRMLEKAGFTEIYASYPQGSKSPKMRGKGRYIGFDLTFPYNSIYVEAKKIEHKEYNETTDTKSKNYVKSINENPTIDKWFNITYDTKLA
jgi:predicted SAM-dependent methyltransferase